jgi:MFS family permease
VGWHIYELTHDPLALGLIGLAEVIPYFSCTLFAGHAVDHYYSRRAFGILAATLLCLNALTLTCVTMGWITGNPSVWIYGSIAFTGIARAFIAPSYTTLFAIIVPRESYARGSGIGSSIFQIGLILGPALGGLLVGFASKTMAYALASALCVGAAAAMGMLKVKEPPAPESPPVFKSIGEGLRFVWSNQIVFGAQMLDMFAVLFGGAVALLPAFIQDVYHMGPETLGLMRAAPAVGAILTGLWLTRHPINLHAGRWLLAAVAGFGLCMIGFALSPYFWLAVALLMVSGVLDGISVVTRQTILQLATPDVMRGRVSAINGIFIGSSNELGAFESGVAAKLLGLVPSVVFGGLMTIGIVGVTAKLAPKLRDLELKQLQ